MNENHTFNSTCRALIIGASGGIGNSIIEKLSKCGANILATGTKIEKLEQLKKI